MRIMIDGMNLALEQGTGVATYARNLARCARGAGHRLSALYGKSVPLRADPVLMEAMFLDVPRKRRGPLRSVAPVLRGLRATRPVRPGVVPKTGLVERREVRPPLPDSDALFNYPNLFDMANTKFSLTGMFTEIVAPEPVDIAHWTYPLPLRVRGAKNIYTIHDLVPLKLPYTTMDRKKRYWSLMKKLVEVADRIVTVSDCSQKDIVDIFKIPSDKVVNTYQSVDIPSLLLEKSVHDMEIELATAFGTVGRLESDGFYLYVGAIEPKKNLRRIIEGFLAAGVQEPLVVVGRRGWQYEEEVAMMARSPRIIYLDYLPFSQMITLMRSARALIFASLYEGFGLPVLEAFLCGTPVITSKVGATAEIAGEAALLVDPYDVGDIRDAIRLLSAAESAELRSRLVTRGHSRARDFQEDTIAERTDSLYREIIDRSKAG